MFGRLAGAACEKDRHGLKLEVLDGKLQLFPIAVLNWLFDRYIGSEQLGCSKGVRAFCRSPCMAIKRASPTKDYAKLYLGKTRTSWSCGGHRWLEVNV